jgi:hypothetical protein
MTWWQWIVFIVGTGGGAYGAWRAWRTDRSLRLLGKKWEIVHYDNLAFLLINRQPKTVLDVKIALAPGRFVQGWPASPVRLEPNGEVKFITALAWTAEDAPVVVTWRTQHSAKSRSWSGYMPVNPK